MPLDTFGYRNFPWPVTRAIVCLAQARAMGGTMSILVLLLILGGVIWLFASKNKGGVGSGKVSEAWQSAAAGAEFEHNFNGTGVAVNTSARTLVLGDASRKPSIQIYSFDDVRSWNWNVESGGQHVVYGNVGLVGASALASQNARQNRQNEASTGLFIKVRDISAPEWRVQFPRNKTREAELKRWNEILQQKVGGGH